MKIKIVSDLKKYMKESNEYIEAVGRGEREIDPAMAEHTLVFTPETFSKVFSPERIKLLLAIKDGTQNIYQLAKQLGRHYEAVHRDISYLKGIGIIKIKKNGRSRIPIVERVELPVLGG